MTRFNADKHLSMIRDHARYVLDNAADPETIKGLVETADALATAILALDEHLCRGGLLPADWLVMPIPSISAIS